MRNETEIKIELEAQRSYLQYIEKNIPAGDCHWRICKAKIELLEWVLRIEQ